MWGLQKPQKPFSTCKHCNTAILHVTKMLFYARGGLSFFCLYILSSYWLKKKKTVWAGSVIRYISRSLCNANLWWFTKRGYYATKTHLLPTVTYPHGVMLRSMSRFHFASLKSHNRDISTWSSLLRTLNKRDYPRSNEMVSKIENFG